MNLATQPVHSYSKEMQLHSKRIKPTQKQMGSIRTKVRQQVRQRSKGICEVRQRCDGARAIQQAHIIGRKQISHLTMADDLLDACVSCHKWLDETTEGIRFKRALREKGE